MRVAIIRRNVYLGHRNLPDPGISQFVVNQFLEFLVDAFGDAFVPVGVHCGLTTSTRTVHYIMGNRLNCRALRRFTPRVAGLAWHN